MIGAGLYMFAYATFLRPRTIARRLLFLLSVCGAPIHSPSRPHTPFSVKLTPKNPKSDFTLAASYITPLSETSEYVRAAAPTRDAVRNSL